MQLRLIIFGDYLRSDSVNSKRIRRLIQSVGFDSIDQNQQNKSSITKEIA